MKFEGGRFEVKSFESVRFIWEGVNDQLTLVFVQSDASCELEIWKEKQMKIVLN